MPEITDNRQRWDGDYHWEDAGDEWSQAWGNTPFEWWTSLYPRIQGFLPAARILEIAPGFGRWTHYLRDHCDELVGVDLSMECVEAIKRRFPADTHLRFIHNDGKSLDGVEDGSIDFAFSFGSLIHVESDVIWSYLAQLKEKLSADGVAFLHHSNIASEELLVARPRNVHWRGETVSAALVARLCEQLGLSLRSQELMPWIGDDSLISDCFSVFTQPGGRFSLPEPVISTNREFNAEISAVKRLSEIYPADPFYTTGAANA